MRDLGCIAVWLIWGCNDKCDEILITRGISTYGMVLEVYKYDESSGEVIEVFSLPYSTSDSEGENVIKYCNIFDPRLDCIDTIWVKDGIYNPEMNSGSFTQIYPLEKQGQETYIYNNEVKEFVKEIN